MSKDFRVQFSFCPFDISFDYEVFYGETLHAFIFQIGRIGVGSRLFSLFHVVSFNKCLYIEIFGLPINIIGNFNSEPK
jgi:hypothetical protein